MGVDFKPYQGMQDLIEKRHIINQQAVRLHYAEPWQFRIMLYDGSAMFETKLETYHNLFDFLAREVSFGPNELLTEPVEAGGTVFTYPKQSQPCVITCTVRDTADRELYKWFDELMSEVVNSDGTFNLPNDYCYKMKILSYKDDGADEKDLWEGLVYPTKMGDIQMSQDGQNFVEFPIIFQQFNSLGVMK